ncbi:FidL-like protein [Serratia aquatilis]|uniref:FidL-like protein n=1 Tax=Serratia aquatilis TaxID=1737515 RepID=UPI0038517392
MFFTAKISELNNMYITRITQEDIDKRDNLPKELWLQYMFPKSSGGEFYSEIKEMNKNAVLIQSLSNPFYICVRAEDQY